MSSDLNESGRLGVENRQLRGYQERIVAEASERNSIVVLPTGTGKTLIGCALILHIMRTRSARKTLFIVPTIALMDQQAAVIARETGLRVITLGGGRQPTRLSLKNADIVVALPAAFMNAYEENHTSHITREENNLFSFKDFGLVVFDEVHHMIKDDPYTHTARAIATEHARSGHRPQILGLTASITYRTNEKHIRRDVKRMARLLQVNKTQLLIASEEELVAGGYHGNPKTIIYVPTSMDEGDMGGGQPLQPDFDTLLSRLDQLSPSPPVPLPQLAKCVYDTMRSLEHRVHKFRHPSGVYVSPVTYTKEPTYVKMDGWAQYAVIWGRSATHPHAKVCYELLEHFYIAVRLMVVAAKLGGLEFALRYLVMEHILPDPRQNSGQKVPYCGSDQVQAILDPLVQMWRAQGHRFVRLQQLQIVLSEQKSTYGHHLRCIVFFKQRLCTHIAHDYLRTSAKGMRTAVVYGAGAVTRQLGLTPTAVKSVLADFASGHVCVLLSTSVTEEGLDIPSANTVIRFDSILTPTSLVQSRGRAHAHDSRFVVMGDGLARRKSVRHMHTGELAQMAAIHAIAKEARSNGGVESDPWSTDEGAVEREYARATRKTRAAKRAWEYAEGRGREERRERAVPEWDGTFVYGPKHLNAGGEYVVVMGTDSGDLNVCTVRNGTDGAHESANAHEGTPAHEHDHVQGYIKAGEPAQAEDNGTYKHVEGRLAQIEGESTPLRHGVDERGETSGDAQLCTQGQPEARTRVGSHNTRVGSHNTLVGSHNTREGASRSHSPTEPTATRNHAKEFLTRMAQSTNTAGAPGSHERGVCDSMQQTTRTHAPPVSTQAQGAGLNDPTLVTVRTARTYVSAEQGTSSYTASIIQTHQPHSLLRTPTYETPTHKTHTHKTPTHKTHTHTHPHTQTLPRSEREDMHSPPLSQRHSRLHTLCNQTQDGENQVYSGENQVYRDRSEDTGVQADVSQSVYALLFSSDEDDDKAAVPLSKRYDEPAYQPSEVPSTPTPDHGTDIHAEHHVTRTQPIATHAQHTTAHPHERLARAQDTPTRANIANCVSTPRSTASARARVDTHSNANPTTATQRQAHKAHETTAYASVSVSAAETMTQNQTQCVREAGHMPPMGAAVNVGVTREGPETTVVYGQGLGDRSACERVCGDFRVEGLSCRAAETQTVGKRKSTRENIDTRTVKRRHVTTGTAAHDVDGTGGDQNGSTTANKGPNNGPNNEPNIEPNQTEIRDKELCYNYIGDAALATHPAPHRPCEDTPQRCQTHTSTMGKQAQPQDVDYTPLSRPHVFQAWGDLSAESVRRLACEETEKCARLRSQQSGNGTHTTARDRDDHVGDVTKHVDEATKHVDDGDGATVEVEYIRTGRHQGQRRYVRDDAPEKKGQVQVQGQEHNNCEPPEREHSNGCYARGAKRCSQQVRPSGYIGPVDTTEWSDAELGTLSQPHMATILRQCDSHPRQRQRQQQQQQHEQEATTHTGTSPARAA